MAKDQKGFYEMTGEFLRELAVLVLVFYPLELRHTSRKREEFGIVCLAALCLVAGILIERWRER